MTYTKKQRRGIAEAFRAAKARLWDGNGSWPFDRDRYICRALENCGHPSKKVAKEIIRTRLRGAPSLGWWLSEVHGIDGTQSQLQAHRHAWLDKLIEEFEQ